jgi:hypothetical protein
MGVSVDLDDHRGPTTSEVGIVGADLNLSPEVPTVLPELVEDRPHSSLGR